jgi:hypothetical protein
LSSSGTALRPPIRLQSGAAIDELAPDLLGIHLEDDARLARGDEPVTPRHLAIELSHRPPGGADVGSEAGRRRPGFDDLRSVSTLPLAWISPTIRRESGSGSLERKSSIIRSRSTGPPKKARSGRPRSASTSGSSRASSISVG